MTIPYRIRRALQRFVILLGVLLLLSVLAVFAWMLWLSRYVIYTDEGAKLDFNLPYEYAPGTPAQPPAPKPSVPIIYGDSDDFFGDKEAFSTRLQGYTITGEMLVEQLSEVQQICADLPAGTAVLLDVKNLRGEFYYDTHLGRKVKNLDADGVSDLIQTLQSNGCYLIARLPAFRDFWYFIDDEAGHVPYGLPKAGGNGSLWADQSVAGSLHYWLNPASSGALNYLVEILTELRSLGFDEVVFTDFRFPVTDGIRFDGDKTQALQEAAKTLMQACANDRFIISFGGVQLLPEQGRYRIYMENLPASEIPRLVEELNLENASSELVFITNLMDTRYDEYGVLRPLELRKE